MSTSAAAQRLSGKTILITGASSGIGKSCVLEFARTCPSSGLKIIASARRKDRLEALASEVTSAVGNGVKILPLVMDVASPESITSALASLPAEYQEIDVLVNNAGLVQGVDQAPNIQLKDVKTMFDANVTGLIHVTQEVMKGMMKRKGDHESGLMGKGDIIMIGSIAGRQGYPGGSVYCATKAAVQVFADALRRETVGTRLRVMVVDPGQVETEFSLVRFAGDKAKADAVYKGVDPLTPDDIAETVVFAATRRENVVVAEQLVFPNHQAAATVMHRRSD